MHVVAAKLRRVVRRVVGGRRRPDGAPSSDPPAPVDLDFALIVGAQRSGTTWLQMLCAAHPRIAGGEESHLFARYLTPLVCTFYDDRRKYGGAARPQGLPCVLTTAEFDAAVKQFATTALSKLLAAKRGATVAVEKTPDHVLHLHYVRHLFPKAKIVHVIRDGRDVVVSQLAAARSAWNDGWWPTEVADAAQRWVEWVSKGRAFAQPAELYHEVRYESLLTDGPRELARVYDFLGVPLPAAQVERIYADFPLSACKSDRAPRVLLHCGEFKPPPDAKPPEGFFRAGRAGGWRESLTDEQRETVERIAGPLLHELGYAANVAPASV